MAGLALIIGIEELILAFAHPYFLIPWYYFAGLYVLVFLSAFFVNRYAMHLTLRYIRVQGTLKAEKNPITRFLFSHLKDRENIGYFAILILSSIMFLAELLSTQATALIVSLTVLSICSLDALNDTLVVRHQKGENKTQAS